MMYINWADIYKQKDLKTVPESPPDSIKWKDRITGTQFYILKQDYEKYYNTVLNNVLDRSPHDIVNYMDGHGFQSSFPYVYEDNASCTLRDASRLFVLFAYLYNGDGYNKEDLRKSAYKVFFTKDLNSFEKAWQALNILINEKGSISDDICVKALKGGAYKIKKYYLENNDIKDIRGASYLLSYVSEKIIPDWIRDEYIEECIIYAGGGNIFCILPSWAGQDAAYRPEELFRCYTLSAQNAFSLVEISLKSLLTDYKKTMLKIEHELEDRKKLKIYNTVCPESPYMKKGYIPVDGDNIDLNAEKNSIPRTCSLCRVREGIYRLKTAVGEEVCGSCLHKHAAGRKRKAGYVREFERFTGIKVESRIESIEDIKDDGKFVAVVYGDGNNMGAILQNLNSLFDMMYFSRKTSWASYKATFNALKETNPDCKFEIVAVGGDDIFLIVPASGSIDFSIKLIEYFNNEFKNLTASKGEPNFNATMSIGICIAKHKSPIKLMLEHAEQALANAKKVSRENVLENKDKGSLDFILLDSMQEDMASLRNSDGKDVNITLLPYSLDRAKGMESLVRHIKSSHTKKSNLYQMKQAFESTDLIEAILYYCYNQAKNKKELDEVIISHPIDNLIWKKGYFASPGNKEFYSPWRDILDLWDFCGGENFE